MTSDWRGLFSSCSKNLEAGRQGNCPPLQEWWRSPVPSVFHLCLPHQVAFVFKTKLLLHHREPSLLTDVSAASQVGRRAKRKTESLRVSAPGYTGGTLNCLHFESFYTPQPFPAAESISHWLSLCQSVIVNETALILSSLIFHLSFLIYHKTVCQLPS